MKGYNNYIWEKGPAMDHPTISYCYGIRYGEKKCYDNSNMEKEIMCP